MGQGQLEFKDQEDTGLGGKILPVKGKHKYESKLTSELTLGRLVLFYPKNGLSICIYN